MNPREAAASAVALWRAEWAGPCRRVLGLPDAEVLAARERVRRVVAAAVAVALAGPARVVVSEPDDMTLRRWLEDLDVARAGASPSSD